MSTGPVIGLQQGQRPVQQRAKLDLAGAHDAG